MNSDLVGNIIGVANRCANFINEKCANHLSGNTFEQTLSDVDEHVEIPFLSKEIFLNLLHQSQILQIEKIDLLMRIGWVSEFTEIRR